MSDYMRNRRGEETDSFFCRFTFGQFFALLVLEVFSLFFVFYLGARYGREFLGLDSAPFAVEVGAAQGEIAADESRVITTTDAGSSELAKELLAKAKTPELKDRIAKMFEGASREGPAPAMPPVAETSRGVSNETPPPAAALPPASAEEPVAPRTAEAEMPPTGEPAPPLAKQETPDESTAPQAAASGGVVRVKSVDNARYSVQVGSYPKMDEATRSVEKWKGKGYSAYMMIANIPDRGQWYRVRIGGFGSHDEAAKYLSEFKSRENVDALVVMNEQ